MTAISMFMKNVEPQEKKLQQEKGWIPRSFDPWSKSE